MNEWAGFAIFVGVVIAIILGIRSQRGKKANVKNVIEFPDRDDLPHL
jgi:hypothetical protein